jgi:protein SCO1
MSNEASDGEPGGSLRLYCGRTIAAQADIRKSREYFLLGPIQSMGAMRRVISGGMDFEGDEVMRAHHWIQTIMSGLVGFAVALLFVAFFVSAHESGQGARVVPVGGPFTLVDDTGAPVTERTLLGKPLAMYFGYTFCPDVCPTALLDLSHWIQELGPDADKINYVFVTIDPRRDTPALMHNYLSSFDKHIRGFTGTSDEIAAIAREYHVYYKRIPTDNGGYVMDHSTIIYLMGPDGRFVNVIAYQENDASALTKLKNLVEITPSS